MDADARAPDAADEEFLDRAFEQAVALLERGTDPLAAELLEGREHLRDRLESLLCTARHVAVIRAGVLPAIRGFQVLAEIGRGGMGTVYLARQESVGGRRVALKVLPPSAGRSARSRERFLVEAHAIAHLRHPNVVTVHDVIAEDGTCAYAMEWVEGASLGTLIELLRARSTSTEPSIEDARELLGGGAGVTGDTYPLFVCRVGIAIARALGELHRAGLVHRDVKPSNILLRKDGTPLLSDFGLVHAADGAITQTGQFVGTVAYASPEQLGGDPESLDARSDVYALGATLYHALALHLPFDDRRGGRARRASTPTGMLRLIESGRAAPLGQWNRRLPRDLETIVAKAMEPEPARRYPSADELAGDLERLLRLQPIHARRSGLAARALKFLRRNRAPAYGIAAGSLVSLALASLAVIYVFLAPQWVAEHVREARLELLDPDQANLIFVSELFGLSPDLDPDRAISASPALAEAVRHYDAALRWAPFDAEIRGEREVVHGVTLAPEDSAAFASEPRQDLRGAGLRAFLLGNVDTALRDWEEFDRARDLTADADPLVEAGLGILHLVREEPAKAYPRLREAARVFPGVGFLTTYLADAAFRCGELETAERLLEAASKMPRLDPLGAHERVTADLLAAKGRDREAEEVYRRASAAPTGLNYARFLASRGRVEDGIDQYVRLAKVLRGKRVQLEYRSALEDWWASLSEAERLDRIRSTLHVDPSNPRSLVARMKVIGTAELAQTTDARAPLGGTAPAVVLRLLMTLGGRASSPPLESRSLSDLAVILEVENMSRWNEIPRYPSWLKWLQFRAWCIPSPGQASKAIARVGSSLAAATAMVAAGVEVQAQNCPGAPCFQGLGDLPGGAYYSRAVCLSSDGTTIGGASSTAASTGQTYDHEAFLWRSDTGMVYIGDLAGNGNMGEVWGLSPDGSLAVGWSSSASGNWAAYGFAECFRRTELDGMTATGAMPGSVFMSWPTGVSPDGALIVGFVGDGGPTFRAASWTSSTGWVIQGGTSTNSSVFHEMSRNGQWATGREDAGSNSRPIRWSQTGGYEVLDSFLGAGRSAGDAISNDGRIIVGQMEAQQAVLWEEGVGSQLLPDLPGGANNSACRAVLGNGSMIVGQGVSASGGEAVIWDEARTIHRVADVVASAGVVIPPGWTLGIATDIVKNGNVISICGNGTNPAGDTEAWVVRYRVQPHHSVHPRPTRSIPITVLPPVPHVGGTIRLAAGTSTEEIAFVVVESEGERVVLARGANVLTDDGKSVTEIALPDDASLARRTFQLRAGLRDRLTGALRWSDEVDVVVLENPLPER